MLVGIEPSLLSAKRGTLTPHPLIVANALVAPSVIVVPFFLTTMLIGGSLTVIAVAVGSTTLVLTRCCPSTRTCPNRRRTAT